MKITIDTEKDDYMRWCRIQNFIESEYEIQIKEQGERRNIFKFKKSKNKAKGETSSNSSIESLRRL